MMDYIDKLKDKYIISKSLNGIAYIIYKTNANVEIIKNNEGFKLFMIDKTKENFAAYNEYKEQDNLEVDYKKMNRIIKYLKDLSKNFN